ncbi:MAG: hypothetical protein RL094_56 [Candidatus Parcubacteria bacterium]|jgi:hypothetical protein
MKQTTLPTLSYDRFKEAVKERNSVYIISYLIDKIK